VIGSRYACFWCDGMSLCETCESQRRHDAAHALVKIRWSLPVATRDLRAFRLPDLSPAPRLPPQPSLATASSDPAPAVAESAAQPDGSRDSRRPKRSALTASGERAAAVRPPKLRRASQSDVDGLYAIECEAFFSPYPRDFFVTFPRRQNQLILLAEVEPGQIGGYVALRFKWDSRDVSVISIAVNAAHRRRGLGRLLMQAVLDEGARYPLDIRFVRLHVSVFNFPAQSLYKSFGFQPTSWLSAYYEDEYEDALALTFTYR